MFAKLMIALVVVFGLSYCGFRVVDRWHNNEEIATLRQEKADLEAKVTQQTAEATKAQTAFNDLSARAQQLHEKLVTDAPQNRAYYDRSFAALGMPLPAEDKPAVVVPAPEAASESPSDVVVTVQQ